MASGISYAAWMAATLNRSVFKAGNITPATVKQSIERQFGVTI